MKTYVMVVVMIAASLLTQTLFAASVITPEVTTQVADTQTDMIAVGGLIIALAALSLGIRWVKATFF